MYREGLPSRYLGRPLMDVVTMYNSYDATDIFVNPSFLRHFVIKRYHKLALKMSVYLAKSYIHI